MAAESILKYLNLFVDGRGYAGKLEEYTPPELAITTEEFRGGGMDAPVDIDMGTEKLTAAFVLVSYDLDVLSLWGLKANADVQLTARGSLENPDGSTVKVAHKMRGKLITRSAGTWGGGNKPSLTCSASLIYYQEMIGDRVVTELDPVNMVRIVNGVDQLAEHRKNIGL